MAIRDVLLPGKRQSMEEAHRSVAVPAGAGWLRRFLTFAGPGYLIGVGYMDPGNWGTDIGAGAQFGYVLLWSVVFASLLAMLLQTLSARLGLASGRDLAQLCGERYARPFSVALWLFAEVAIVACDLAEAIGSAVALELLFKIPLLWGVFITSADVLLLMGLSSFGFRKLEAVVVTLVATITVAFAIEVYMAKPALGPIFSGTLIPSIPNREALFLVLGILGATVMPHNLYLHSSLVQTRAHEGSEEGVKSAIHFNTVDTIVALGLALFVNAAILLVAAAVFHLTGHTDVEDLKDAHNLLTPLLGGAASTVFVVALLASGQSSTITGTLAGQVVMEGFVHLKVKPWIRRLITRTLAIIPAAFIIARYGEGHTVQLLIVSQVVLSMQLSFAVFPLIGFTSNRKVMGRFVNPKWLIVLGYACAVAIALLNAILIEQTLQDALPKFAWPLTAILGLVILAFVEWGRRSVLPAPAEAR